MDWLKKLIGGGVKEEEQISYLSDFGKNVMFDLAPLSKKDPVLLKDAVSYILKGEPAEILLRLQNKGYGKKLGLLCCRMNSSRDEPRPIFQKVEPNKAVYYWRLLQVYEAAAVSNSPTWIIPAPGISHWLDIFIQEATGLQRNIWRSKPLAFSPTITVEFIEKMLEAAGESTDMLTRAVFLLDPVNFSTPTILGTITSLKGFHSGLARHQKAVLEALNHPEHRQRIQALEILFSDEVDHTPFREKITSLACCSAKTVREAAQKIVIRKPLVFKEPVLQVLNDGDSQERLYAAQLLAQFGTDSKEILRERLLTETAPKVRSVIESLLIEPSGLVDLDQVDSTQVSDELKIQPVPEFKTNSPLSRDIEEDLKNLIRNYNEGAKIYNSTHQKDKYFYKLDLLNESNIHQVFQDLQDMVVKKETRPIWRIDYHLASKFEKELNDIIAKAQIELVHVLRLLIFAGRLHWKQQNSELRLDNDGEKMIRHFFQTHDQTYDIRVISAAAKAIGIDSHSIGWSYLENYQIRHQMIRNPENYWMYYAENQDIIEEALGFRPRTHQIQSYWEKDVKNVAFHILTAFPQPPLVFQAKLWEIALNGPKTERPLAQKCISKITGSETRIIEALKDGRQEVRAEAARWIGELQLKKAIPDLKQALKKEKSDIAKGALMETLETLGAPVDEFLDRSTLKQEAEKALQKGIPSQLQWFPFDVLPSVRWENGEKVESIIIKWLICLGYKLGSANPVPVIRKYCQYMNQADRRQLGRYILQAWLTQDTLPRYTMETATPVAQNQVKQMGRWYEGKTDEELFQMFLNNLLNECLGSAIKEKGILAITAACSGPEVVPMVEAYLKKWYGHRVHQCRALVQMLSWNEDPTAIQLLLSVANRFRTKGIQEEAAQCVNELAERKGWTLDELADRTIPTAGFDEKGQLILDFGARKFICQLNDQLEIEIFNEDGKQVKNLPNPGKDDDPELVKIAKKELSEAKKVLKQVLRLQQERLYENMCTQRSWRFGDLRMFLFDHPLMSRYCQRLVWARFEDGKAVETFRLMEDRTLTNAEDIAVSIDDAAVIRLAHSVNLTPETAALWSEHFADYKIEPLFDQFGKPMYTLKDSDRKTEEIPEFLGYIMDNFKLRSLATKLGYIRGQAEDGGFFYQYKKRFSGLKIEAVIEFSGVPLPEENVKVALKSLYFNQIVDSEPGYYTPECRISLEEIPPVLLSETWNDLRKISEASEGYHPDWEKKVAY